MKPFDLSAALAGHPVCTRDGREVTQLVKFDLSYCEVLIGVMSDCICRWRLDGCYDNFNVGNGADLFMAPVKKTGWVARYAHDDGVSFINATIYGDEVTCVAMCGSALSYHEITWEE